VVTRQTSYVDIQERDDFDDLLQRLSRYAYSTLTVDVSADVEVLATAAEFEELYSCAQEYSVQIEIVSDDPVRQEFARIYGLKHFSESLTDTIALFLQEDANPEVVDREQRTQRRFALDPTEEYSIESGAENGRRMTPEYFSPFDSDASFSFVTAPPTAGAQKRHRKSRRTAVASRRSPVTTSLSTGSIVVSGAAIAVAIAVLLVSLLAPTASIVLVPESRTVGAQVTYGLAGAGEGLDVVVQPTTISNTIAFESSIPASGEMLIPNSPSQGMIFLTNPFTEVMHVAAGTIFASTVNDISYISLEPIDVPAADPFGSARFGTAVVGIEAAEAGPAGNLDVEELTGTLESGILFQNRFPVTGGDLKSVAVVMNEDLEALKALADRDLESKVGSALDAQIPEGWTLVNPPRLVNQVSANYSAEAGTVRDSVSIQAQVQVSADIYDPGALEEEARTRLLGMLSGSVPQGFGLIVDSVRLTVPQDVGGDGSRVFLMGADGTAEAQFDPDFAEQVSHDIIGKSEAHAAETLQQIDGVESYSVDYGPDWLPWEPVPRFSSRISVEINGT
jgi:hypothetical protein